MKELDEAGLVRRRLEEGLEEIYPPLAGSKIMVCMPTDRYSMTVPNRHVFLKTQELFEELRDEYLILYHINSPKKIRPRVSKYYKDAVVEVTDYFTLTELLSVADVAVGDYRPEILDFAATGKPTFFYIPDRNLYTLGEDTGYSYPEFYPGEEIHDAGELVEKLRHPELCDWSRQEEFCQKYAEKSDGKLCHRIVKWMAGQEASE